MVLSGLNLRALRWCVLTEDLSFPPTFFMWLPKEAEGGENVGAKALLIERVGYVLHIVGYEVAI